MRLNYGRCGHMWVLGVTAARVSLVERGCRYALLSLAACEAALQLHLPQHASLHEHWVTLQERTCAEVLKGPYPDVLGEGKATPYGEDVVFVANDWHAGAPCCSYRQLVPTCLYSCMCCAHVRAATRANEAAWPCMRLLESAQYGPVAPMQRCSAVHATAMHALADDSMQALCGDLQGWYRCTCGTSIKRTTSSRARRRCSPSTTWRTKALRSQWSSPCSTSPRMRILKWSGSMRSRMAAARRCARSSRCPRPPNLRPSGSTCSSAAGHNPAHCTHCHS